MNIKEVEKIKDKLEEALEFFEKELKNIRVGRATPSLVEDLPVEYFGTKSPLKQVASISVQDAKTLVISPWSPDSLVEIEKAIRESEMSLNPINDGKVVRIVLPALTEERRRELVKILGKKTEEARIKIRNIREDFWSKVQAAEKKGEISEDEKFRAKNRIQEFVDEYNKKVEEMEAKKEEDIMRV